MQISFKILHKYTKNNSPAMHAVMKQAKHPEIIARKETRTMSSFRSGAMAVSAPIMIPRAVRLANPQRAYVAITTECSYDQI